MAPTRAAEGWAVLEAELRDGAEGWAVLRRDLKTGWAVLRRDLKTGWEVSVHGTFAAKGRVAILALVAHNLRAVPVPPTLEHYGRLPRSPYCCGCGLYSAYCATRYGL